MPIWITRSAPDNLWTARRLHRAGHRPLLAPVSEIQPLPHAPLDQPPHAIVFSSIHAVRNHVMDPALADTPVYACGDRIAAAAAALGYLTTTSLGSETALIGFIAATRAPGSRIAHYCSDYTSDRLQTALADLQIARRQVYRTVPVGEAGLRIAETTLPRADRILVHSAPAAARIAALLQGSNWTGTLHCISPASAALFADMPGLRITIAAQPSEESLLTALETFHPSAASPATNDNC
ncbi:uroporphyrinogen III methyltransferase [Polymorphobacter glacialis]|uniref:Uroporphyrinogen III methyltransferase n=1 Tax=Sandarakinorhabdus glacialis TaxID=1614636 RepID=A0A916ZJJ3_9SPHN|nr:uroporphyrinogen-III synthase [Polymorphobacter glacialis]GGE00687.1 uroporphyrinogen III methyltransferase [Polymorphobacter glacialis]